MVMKYSNQYIKNKTFSIIAAAGMSLFAVLCGLFYSSTVSAAPNATNVSTGASSACGIIDKKVMCWGDGAYGKLGTGSLSDSKKPVSVYINAGRTEKITCQWYQIGCKEKTVVHGASALYGKTVSKVSVGTNHACAIAGAAVFCWGKNDKGQLGTGGGSSSQPVAVVKSGGSALSGKEIVDVSAGDDFTCALASDGKVACWGEGDNGRLGTNSTDDKSTPTPIFVQTGSTTTQEVTIRGNTCGSSGKSSGSQSDSSKGRSSPSSSSKGQSSPSSSSSSSTCVPTADRKEMRTTVVQPSALSGKKGVRLAKASEATMCVIAVDANSTALNGNAYCWGKGIDNGSGIPANGADEVRCGEDSPTSRPSSLTTTSTKIFDSSKPTLIPGATLTSVDGQDYVTGLGTDGRAYYWGMYGYEERGSNSNIHTCTIDPCTGMDTIQRSNDNLNVVVAYGTKSTANAAKGNQLNKNRPKVVNGHPGMANYQIKKDNDKPTCNKVTHYGYTKNAVYTPVGKKDATQPPSWPSSQSGFRAVSGNAYNGLFCATNGSAIQCDAHGTSQSSGQTGSGFAQSCGLFGCSPAAPSGPQSVAGSGWLAGKRITQLSTSSTGYTCAVASGTIGCWGVNSNGQLGVGDNKAKNVPTGVGL